MEEGQRLIGDRSAHCDGIDDWTAYLPTRDGAEEVAYAVEVAADLKDFDTMAIPGERPQETYFTSDWIQRSDKINAQRVSGFHAYTLHWLSGRRCLICLDFTID